MVRKIVWFLIPAVLGAISAFYLWTAAFHSLSLLRFQGQTEARILEWHAKEETDGYFYPYALFSYEVDGKNYQNFGFYHDPYARNPYALEPELIELSRKTFQVFYSESSPERSLLEKRWPLKDLMKGLISLIIGLYFFCLKKQEGITFPRIFKRSA